MKEIAAEITIIGGGLTGLCLAHLLQQQNRRVHLLEARPRLGGRICTHRQPGFAPQVRNFSSYEETVWRKEIFTFSPYESHVLPHQNNGHPLYRQAYLDGQLWIAGSETAANFPGYMEGAVQSALFIAQQIASC